MNENMKESALDTTELSNIRTVSSWDSGGGVMLDVLELADGRVLAISEDVIILYESMEDLESGDPGVERPFIPL